MPFQLLIRAIQLKETDRNTKINETENKILDHDQDEHITTQEVKKLMAEKFGKRLKQANSGKKKDTTDFVKNTDFDNKLKSINKKITSKNVETEKNLNDLAEKVKLTSTKR